MVTMFLALLIIVASLRNVIIKPIDIFVKIVFIIVLLIVFYGHVRTTSEDNSYKKGQIDALTNNIQYKLVTMPDSTKVWERIIEEVK